MIHYLDDEDSYEDDWFDNDMIDDEEEDEEDDNLYTLEALNKHLNCNELFIGWDKSIVETKEAKEYCKYLRTHITGVFKSWQMIKDTLLQDNDITEDEYGWIQLHVICHDNSKYDKDEFIPYLHAFYPKTKNTKMSNEQQKEYDLAWYYHQSINPHHWQYWLLIRDEGNIVPMDMNKKSIIEMLCDWSSFQYIYPGRSANKWYNDNKDIMILSDNTRTLIEYYLAKFPEL